LSRLSDDAYAEITQTSVIFVVDEYVRLEQHGEMQKRCDRSRKDIYIVQIAVYHLLNMKVDQAFGYFDELAGSLLEHQ
jgi:hypothetical protein